MDDVLCAVCCVPQMLSEIPALHDFGVLTCLLVITNYIMVTTFMLSALCVWDRHFRAWEDKAARAFTCWRLGGVSSDGHETFSVYDHGPSITDDTDGSTIEMSSLAAAAMAPNDTDGGGGGGADLGDTANLIDSDADDDAMLDLGHGHDADGGGGKGGGKGSKQHSYSESRSAGRRATRSWQQRLLLWVVRNLLGKTRRYIVVLVFTIWGSVALWQATSLRPDNELPSMAGQVARPHGTAPCPADVYFFGGQLVSLHEAPRGARGRARRV